MQTLKKTTALTTEQIQIYENKYAEVQVGKLPDAELIKSVKKIIFRISVITGWQLPEEKFILEILYDELFKKLKEDYPDLNIEEIAYAVRQYGTTVKDWGKNMNLSLLDEVLIPYKSRRLEVSRIEEQAAHKALQNELPYSEPIADYDTLIKTAKDVFLKTNLIGLIPVKVYDILEQQGEIVITVEEKQAIRNRVESRLINEATKHGLKAIREFNDLKHNKRDYEILVRNECKKQVVANYFTLQNNIDNF